MALSLMVAVAVAAAPVLALEPPPGSRNFSAPGYVPNYFSNEAGAMRGEPASRAAPAETAPVAALPAAPSESRSVVSTPAGRHHAVHAGRAKQRARLARHKASAHGRSAHVKAGKRGKSTASRTARGKPNHAASKTSAAKSRAAPAKTQRVARAHG